MKQKILVGIFALSLMTGSYAVSANDQVAGAGSKALVHADDSVAASSTWRAAISDLLEFFGLTQNNCIGCHLDGS